MKILYSSIPRYTVQYKYGADGQRANKYAKSSTESETIYFNKMFTWRYDEGAPDKGGKYSKHIFLGDTRVTTKIFADLGSISEESEKQYFYHGDHLGSAQLVTDSKGRQYQRIEYTPYGESWIEQTSDDTVSTLPYKFTAKEKDEETGLYYYGVRYLDSRTSRWLSTDPALGDYIPGAPVNDEVKKANQNLPGMGGVFNVVNFHLYHYAGNNPVKYTDPDGRFAHIVIGAAIGATASAAVSVFSQLINNGKVDLATTVIAVGAGAISGGLAASGVGLVGQIAGNGLISVGQNLLSQTSKNEGDATKIDYNELGTSFVIGMLSGLLGGKGAETGHIRSMTQQLTKRITNAFAHKSGDMLKKEIVNAFLYFMKNSGIKEVNKETLKAILRSNIPAIYELGKDGYEKIVNEISGGLK